MSFSTILLAILGSSAFSVLVSKGLDYFKPTRHEEKLSSLVSELEAQIKLSEMAESSRNANGNEDSDLSEVVTLLNLSARNMLKQRLPRILLPSGLLPSFAVALTVLAATFALVAGAIALGAIWNWSQTATTLISAAILLIACIATVTFLMHASTVRDQIRGLIYSKLKYGSVKTVKHLVKHDKNDNKYVILPRRKDRLLRNFIGVDTLETTAWYLNE
ncbi:hypothetical protein [Brevibacterium linens]|uniref:Uncharacterized protein n=2 Tax=Brevibacterium linens TaxID=1703 RepID=A0A2H1JS07_BRELN|nr:hypothetical protein [Brevibacterium linens]AZU01162.1 hypothetical protein CXR29_10995 [Brevibacterium linens]KAB1950042.1 hypothetical protein F8227_01390 [Brevibacterium linens ATCC 9172]SMX67836.1 hypothetical protein BLIN9172_00593 [Brevibacterium linens ATCC 9172]SMX90231.1 hypothetical protein BLIN101_02611 [Brevibacterium linens]